MAEPTWNLRGIVLADPHPITIPTSPSSSLTTFRDAISHATSIPIASLLLFRPNDPKFSLHDPALRRIQAEATSRHALPTSVSGVIAAATLVGVEEATVGQWFEETVMKVKGHVPDIIHFFVMVAPRSSGSSAARTAAAQQSSAPKPIPHVKTMPVPPVRSESNNNILRIVNLQSDLFKPTSQTSDLSLMSPQSRQPAPPRSGGNVTGATSLDSPPPMSPQGPPPTFQQAMATRARANTGGPSPPPMSQQASASQSQQPLKSGPSNVPPSIMKPTPGPQPQQPPISGSNNPPTSIMKNSPQQFQDSSRPRANTGAPTSPQPTPQGPAPQYQQSPRSQPKSNSPSLDTSPQSPKSPSPQQPSRSGPPSTSPYNTPPMSPQTRSRSNTGILLPQDNPSPPTLQSPSSPNHNYFPPPQPQFQPLPSTSRGRSTLNPQTQTIVLPMRRQTTLGF
ncbi:hypothetical protein BC829DRAFT_487980 [Chytridium lagenaria]|nr:hypothetical protein BC829DRAFT_487980 [Chytridium lagenaria]